MPSSILTNDFRQQLEQQRLRLTNEREAIVQAAIDQATADIDRSLAHINALLGEQQVAANSNGAVSSIEANVEASLVETATPSATPKADKQPKSASENTAPTPKSRKTAKQPTKGKAAKAKPAAQSTSASRQLKREFQDMTPAEAIEQVLVQSPDRAFTSEDLIEAIYGSLDDASLRRTRQSVALTLSHGRRRGVYLKVQDDPAQFKVNPNHKPQADASQ